MLQLSEDSNKVVTVCIGQDRDALIQAVGRLLSCGERVLATSPGGILVKQHHDVGRGDFIFNPLDDRSPNWDLRAEIKSEKDVRELAYSLIPETVVAPDRERREHARTFFIGVTQRLWEMNHRVNRKDPQFRAFTAQRLYDILMTEPVKKEREHEIGLEDLLEGTPARRFLYGENAELFGSIRIIAGSALRAFGYPNGPDRDGFSVREWVKQSNGAGQGGALFIPYEATDIPALKSLVPIWVRLGLFEALSHPVNYRTLWLIFDGADCFDRIHGLEYALGSFRDLRIRLVLGIESLIRFSELYGRGTNMILEAAQIRPI